MDVGTLLLELVAPLVPGDEIMSGVVILGPSTELGLRLRVDVRGTVVWFEMAALDSMPLRAAETELLGIAYRTEGGRSSLDSSFGLLICKALAARVSANEHRVVEQLRFEAAAEDDPTARIRRVTVSSALDPSGVGEVTHYTINPYVGCVVGCKFCYAQTPISGARSLMGLKSYEWGSYVEARTNLPEILREEVKTHPPGVVKFCPIIGDSYQPIERTDRITRRCLEVLADAGEGWIPLVLTRTDLALRDLDVFERLSRALVGISLPTVDDEVRRHFEPRSASVEQRLNLLARIRETGTRTLVLVQPIMQGSLVELADRISENADGAQIGVLEGVQGAGEEFSNPAYAHTTDENWQRDRALELMELLTERGVPHWTTDVPPEFA
ncbi:MAG: DNA repair photolyase [Bradymonadia bacterium]